MTLNSFSQKASNAEKCWAITHPFVAKKAYRISKEVQNDFVTVKKKQLLKGTGNGNQLDAFRHTYWMAILTTEIGARRTSSLGKAHEKGNYNDYRKRINEDGAIPDKVSSDMDLFNNDVGIQLAKDNIESSKEEILLLVKQYVKKGKCKIIKTDSSNNFLDVDGNIIAADSLKGKWENDKCLVNSDY